MVTNRVELLEEDSSSKGDYDPDLAAAGGSPSPVDWNGLASMSTSTGFSHSWDAAAYTKLLDNVDESDSPLYMSADWLEAASRDAIMGGITFEGAEGAKQGGGVVIEDVTEEEVAEEEEQEGEGKQEEEAGEEEEEAAVYGEGQQDEEEINEEQAEENEDEAEEETEENEVTKNDSYIRFQTAQSRIRSDDNSRNEVIVRHDSKGFQRDPLPLPFMQKEIGEEDDAAPLLSPAAPLPPAVAVVDTTKPFTLAQIDLHVQIRHVPGKGRCCFAKHDFRPGDVIFAELPTLAAVPSLDPPLWEVLTKLHKEEPLELPPIWHLAALYSLTRLPREKVQTILDKWVPDENKPPGKDVARVLTRTRLGIDPRRYDYFLQVWRYNSFGHHAEAEGLVLYDRISMLAHDCAATACWHYGDNDAFILRARQFLKKGQEITISYLGDDDLFKSTNVRQDKLAGWLFKCGCRRCSSNVDTSRGFRCPSCGAGTVFFKTDRNPNVTDPGVTTSSACSLCASLADEPTIEQYLEFEVAYTARLSETDKNDLSDAELVYAEAQRVFNQHWVLFALDGILFDAYRERRRWIDAAAHQTNRISYASQVIPQASYTLAWLYEERGDALSNACEEPVSGFFRNIICFSYETAMNMLIVLSGWRHPYTLAAGQKLAKYNTVTPT